jgi:HK97 family phage major capsid protein/HK97 family phage prohead protease
MKTKQRPEKIGVQERHAILRPDVATEQRGLVDLEARTMRLPFSSDAPIDMWWGSEILSHEKGAMRNGQRQQNLPLLYNHNRDDLLGAVASIDIGKDGRGYACIRFGRDERGEWAMQQVQDGILSNVSFMYQVYKYIEDLEADTYTGIDWEVYEVSLVTVPADASVGVGRAAATDALPAEIIQRAAAPPHDAPPQTEPASAGFLLPEETRAQPATAETQEGKQTMKLRHVLQDTASDGTSGSAGGTISVEETNRLRGEIQTQERARITEVEAMCRAHRLNDDFRNDLITKGFDIAECRGRVLIELQKRGQQKPLGSVSGDIGLTDKEQRSYSLMRAINALVTGGWEGAGFEREVSVEIGKRNSRETGNGRFFFPNDLPFAPTRDHLRAYRAVNSNRGAMGMRAPYLVGTAGQGGNLVETDLLAESFIEVLRNQTVTQMLGATYLPGLVGNVDIPRQITATGTYWVGEAGAITEAEGTFDKVQLRPKTIGALSKISRLMLLQSTPAIEMLARRDLMAVGALAIDLAALSGSGSSNQPTGVVNQAGVGSVVGGTNGALVTFDNIIQLQYATKAANAPQANTGYALNSKTIGYLSTLKSTTGQYLWDPQGGLTNNTPDRLKGRAYAESQQLRSNLVKGTSGAVCSELIYGNWQELLIGEWGVTEIALNPYDSTGFTTGDVLLRMFQTIDIGVRHGASFAVMSDALTTGF